MCGKRNLLHWSMCGKRNLLHWSMGGKRNHGTHPWAGKGYYHGCTETVWRWWVRSSSIGQATRLTSRWRWTGRCRCRYWYICTEIHSLRLKLCSVKYIVAVVYVRLHKFISSLPLFKHPKKYRFYKSFLISKATLVRLVGLAASFQFKRRGHLWFYKCYKVENIIWYSSMSIGIHNICVKFFQKKIVGRHFCIGFAPLFLRSSSPLKPVAPKCPQNALSI